MQIEQQLRQFITENFLFGRDSSFASDASLLETGIVDSTGMLELIAFLEETYGIEVHDEEMTPQNLDSIHNLLGFVERKRYGKVAVAG
jgi:acyl carrier protein